MDSRFLKKTLTDEEIEIVNLSRNPDTALWSFWACKEAAYKVIKNLTMKTLSSLVAGLLKSDYRQRNILYLRDLKVMLV